MNVTIGSPAITGAKSNELLADHFLQATYPMNVRVINHMPRSFRHNHLNLNLLNSAGGVDTQADVVVHGFSQIQKLCTEAEAISELNNYSVGIEIIDLDAPKPVEEPVATEEPAVVLEPAQEDTKPVEEPVATEEAVTAPAKSSRKGGNHV